MDDILAFSNSIKQEAKSLLNKYSIIETIKNYGMLKFTGSYELDLMLKKDIDISLINDNMQVADFTQLGKELIDKLNTPTVYYRNTNITPVDKRPENAMYWGIKTGEWWIDIWAMNESVYKRAESYISEIKSKLTQQNRITILQLKNELLSLNLYGEKFGSRELYDAVLNNNVSSFQSFEEYIKEKASQNEYK
ncbi:MAG: hypothetical protein OQJ81_04560 [Melioribacteraceae bacterium]|nr:hypothetical protein [Melioribacteraceae bacterium]